MSMPNEQAKQWKQWLNGTIATPNEGASVSGLAEQLRLQDQLAQKISAYRDAQGNLEFSKVELAPTVKNGAVVSLDKVVQNRAQLLIENLMIAANVCMSKFFEQQQIPLLKRAVKEPKRWDRIVGLAQARGVNLPAEPDVKALQAFLIGQHTQHAESFGELSLAVIKLIGRGEYIVGLSGEISPGHFDLALKDYAHTTAPNRRFPDLIIQRLLKAHLQQAPAPYSIEELELIAARCTQKEDDATKVERRVRKSAIAKVFASRIGEQFIGIITGASSAGTWVRLIDLPVEGKLIKGWQGVDVGDHVTVKLVDVNVTKGFIDFVRVN